MSKYLTAADRSHSTRHGAQKSLMPPVGGRGRDAGSRRRAHMTAGPDAEQFLRRWSMLMIVSFPSAEACALFFGVTSQTACNWREGSHRPYGDAVDFAMRSLPEYSRVMLE